MADNKLQTFTERARTARRRPDYKDVAFAKGVTAQRPYTGGDVRPSTAWHAQFEDVNNDGLVDLFIAKGNVAEMPDFAAKDPNNLLLQGGDGKFAEVGDKAGIASMAVSRGAALADFNLDGLLDLVVVNRGETRTALAQHHAERRPLDRAAACSRTARTATRSAPGSRCGAETTVMRREITVGGGHASGQSGWWHFGLGESPASRGARDLARRRPPATGNASTATISTYSSATRRLKFGPRNKEPHR